ETLRIASSCSREMVAWVRYAAGSRASDNVVKLDIDLCDRSGKICVQMHGFSARPMAIERREIETAVRESKESAALVISPLWQDRAPTPSAIDYVERHVLLCAETAIDVEPLQRMVPLVQLLSLPTAERNLAQRYTDCAAAGFERIQGILQGRPRGRVLMQIVVTDHEEQTLFAGLSALLRTAELENPQIAGQLLMVPAAISLEDLAERLEREAVSGDRVIRYKDGIRQLLEWTEVPVETGAAPIAFRDDGVYLITGGRGGLGSLFAKEILTRAAHSRVILTGRSP